MKKVRETAEKIRTLKIQGAMSIALAAANAIEHLIEGQEYASKEELVKDLEKAGEILKDARPTAVALPNAVNAYIQKVKESKKELPELKRDAIRIGRKCVDEIINATELVAKFGAVEIESGMTVLVHCHSSTVMGILKEAWNQGKEFNVICTETRPFGQGYISSKELSGHGIPTQLIVDSAANFFMPQVDLVLVGADTITKKKEVINKIGTSGIALIAEQHKVPFYVATQTLKFDSRREAKDVEIEERDVREIIDPEKLPKVTIRNPVFDVTPASRVARFITENGVQRPGEINI